MTDYDPSGETTKLSGLSKLNLRAIEEVYANSIASGAITMTATTATFTGMTAQEWANEVGDMIAHLPMRGHPRASLHAVRRRLQAAADVAAMERYPGMRGMPEQN